MTETATADESEDVEAEETETPTPGDAVAEEQADGDEDQPPVEGDEMAALDAVREEVAAETDAPDPTTSDPDEADGDGEQDEEEAAPDVDSGEGEIVDGQDTAGDFYVNTLVSVSNMVIEEHGRDGADEIDGAMLRQMGVDDAVDELLADDGGPDMPPEQQVLLGTTVFGLAMLASKTTVLDQALENADLNL